jgi:hypothetical protein
LAELCWTVIVERRGEQKGEAPDDGLCSEWIQSIISKHDIAIGFENPYDEILRLR